MAIADRVAAVRVVAQQTNLIRSGNVQEELVLTEEKLSSFVDAALEVQDVTQGIAPKAEAAENDAERQALAEEANNAIRGAIEETPGITIEEYVAIGQAAQQDPDLAQLIARMAQAKTTANDG